MTLIPAAKILMISFFFLSTHLHHLSAQKAITISSVHVTEEAKSRYSNVPVELLVDEINRRVDNKISVNSQSKGDNGQIVLMANTDKWPVEMEKTELEKYPLPENEEGYRILRMDKNIYIQAQSQRGIQYGIGHLLRESTYDADMVWAGSPVASSPEKPIRGHQIGYRNTANSYDAWTVEVYEQYIRDMIVFGANSIENIPFSKHVPIHFTIPADSMNAELGRLCRKYDMDYWVWTPISFDLNDERKTKEYLARCEKLYRTSPRLDAVFVPGGDPGDNPPDLVLPVMEKMAELLQKHHPQAQMWLSMQGFKDVEEQHVYDYMENESPDWMGGLVAGPSSPSMAQTRAALPARYELRHYPDITHTVRCQYPNWWWDPAFNFTLGREPINPQPVRYQNIYRYTAPYTDGFITYSDGMHDDLNKMVWSRLGWSSSVDIHKVVKEYASYFLHSPAADMIADGLFALERNWDGAVSTNGSIQATKALWESIDHEYNISENWMHWRWKMYLLRAKYDAYIQRRFRYEVALEKQANEILKQADRLGAQTVMDSVKNILSRSAMHFKKDEDRNQIYHLGDDLFEIIGFQPSVPLYQASNPERGAIIEFIDRPLNNEWWLLSEFDRMEGLSEKKKVMRLMEMGNWEEAGEGGYYDDIGNINRSPHVIKVRAPETDPLFSLSDNPGFDWWESGYSRERLSWMSSMRWPHGLEYIDLDPEATYTLRLTGVGDAFPLVEEHELRPTKYGKKTGDIKEFPIPRRFTQDGRLTIRFREIDESHLNWRQHSRLNEAWLIRIN